MTTLTQNTSIDRIEIVGGTVQVRITKQVLSGDSVIAAEFHRLSLAPGTDMAAQLVIVNADLTALGAAAISDSDWATVTTICSAVWTDAVVAAYKASIASTTTTSTTDTTSTSSTTTTSA